MLCAKYRKKQRAVQCFGTLRSINEKNYNQRIHNSYNPLFNNMCTPIQRLAKKVWGNGNGDDAVYGEGHLEIQDEVKKENLGGTTYSKTLFDAGLNDNEKFKHKKTVDGQEVPASTTWGDVIFILKKSEPPHPLVEPVTANPTANPTGNTGTGSPARVKKPDISAWTKLAEQMGLTAPENK